MRKKRISARIIGIVALMGVVLGVVNVPTALAAPQIARPVADYGSVNFLNPPHWEDVDEATSDGDTTFAQSLDTGSSWMNVNLSALTDPASSTGHTLRVTARKSAASGAQVDLKVRLRRTSGSPTIIAERIFTNIGETYVTQSFTLTTAEADSITTAEYGGGLWVQVLATVGSGTARYARVTKVEFEVPGESEPEPSPSPSPSPSPPPGGCTPTVQLSGSDADGHTVPAGACHAINGLYTTPKNVIVYGTLQMLDPGDHLRFTNINEANYVGGGNFSSSNPPPASEVGLFVLDAGILDAQGTPKVAWNRTGDDPSWLATDELRVAPIAQGEFGTADFALWTKGNLPPTARADLPRAEVLNLTRDVVIEGTATGRSHIYIKSSSIQQIKYVLVRHMGPRHSWGDEVLGRWPLHFHMMGNASRGMVVEGVVVRNAGSFAFVPHASHGITLRNNIAYDVIETAYWWDHNSSADFTHDSLWENNVAAKVNSVDNNEPRFAGFRLGEGGGNVANGNVAVGVHGSASDAAGYHWPNTGPNWVFDNNVAHNNEPDCHSVWENANSIKTINNFIGYRCQKGNNQGAYNPTYHYIGGIFALNDWLALEQHAVSANTDRPSSYVGVKLDGKVKFVNTNANPGAPLLFLDVTGVTQVELDNGGQAGHWADFVACDADHAIEPADFVRTRVHANDLFRVQRMNGTAYKVTAAGTTTIPAFYTC